MKTLVSIIIPIYNAETHLKKCIESILNQTFKDFELILINDGSTDNSENICLELQKKDKRIKYYYKNNSGVSSTRNFGLKKSNGEYVYYVDADDYLENNALERFVYHAKKNNADIIRGSYKINNKLADETKYLSNFYNNPQTEIEESILVNFINYRLNPAVWLLFMKRNIAEKHMFLQNFGYGEDLLYTLDLLLDSPKIVFIDDLIYNYIVNEAGASNNINKFERNIANLTDLAKEVEIILSKYKVKNKEYLLSQAVVTYFYMAIHYLYLEKENNQINYSDFIKKIKKLRNSEIYSNTKILKLNNIKKIRKIVMFLFKYRLYPIVYLIFIVKKFIKEVKKK